MKHLVFFCILTIYFNFLFCQQDINGIYYLKYKHKGFLFSYNKKTTDYFIKIEHDTLFEFYRTLGLHNSFSNGTIHRNKDTLVLNSKYQEKENDLEYCALYKEELDSAQILLVFSNKTYNQETRPFELLINNKVITINNRKDFLKDTIFIVFNESFIHKIQLRKYCLTSYCVNKNIYNSKLILLDKEVNYVVINLPNTVKSTHYEYLTNERFLLKGRKLIQVGKESFYKKTRY